jgi:hypothetical protein
VATNEGKSFPGDRPHAAVHVPLQRSISSVPWGGNGAALVFGGGERKTWMETRRLARRGRARRSLACSAKSMRRRRETEDDSNRELELAAPVHGLKGRPLAMEWTAVQV